MADRIALVTGASRGIGRAIALALADSGHVVGINYRSDAESAKQTLEAIESGGGQGYCVQANVARPAEVERLFDEVEAWCGPIEVLVNNAGVRADGLALTMTDETWDRVMRVNLYGPFACCRRALPSMLRARWGRIVNVGSVAGLRGSPGQINYSAAKAGLIGLTRTLAAEVARKGITVNAVAPGLIDSDLTADLNVDARNGLIQQVPMQRAGSPQEVASMVAFLCSDQAAYATGSVFVADGGMTA